MQLFVDSSAVKIRIRV